MGRRHDQAHAEEERHKEELIKQAILDRDGYQAELLKEADGTHWATVQVSAVDAEYAAPSFPAMISVERLTLKAYLGLISPFVRITPWLAMAWFPRRIEYHGSKHAAGM